MDEPYYVIIFTRHPLIGLTSVDCILLIACPISAALGTFVASVLGKHNPVTSNNAGEKKEQSNLLGRFLAGLVLGLVIALFFVGAIVQSTISITRILALCILLGYQAENIWNVQEKVLDSLIEKKLRSLLEGQNVESKQEITHQE